MNTHIFEEVGKAFGKTGLKIRKYSPEILMTAGVAGMTVTVILACKGTLKAQPIFEETKEQVEAIKKEEKESKEEAKELTTVYFNTGKKLVKVYWPAATLGVLSTASILGGFGIIRGRYICTVAAYKGLEESYSKYRARVIEKFGEEVDKKFKNGISEVELEEDKEDGKKKKIKQEGIEDPDGISNYARFFDESNVNWQKDPGTNLFFLKAQQTYANDLLRARGHIFLNEVYDMLGFDRTKEGAVVGWVMGNGDNYVDFGIYDHIVIPRNKAFVNGYENVALLDFNVDGLIFDKI